MINGSLTEFNESLQWLLDEEFTFFVKQWYNVVLKFNMYKLKIVLKYLTLIMMYIE